MLRQITFWLSTIAAIFGVQQFLAWHPDAMPETILICAISAFSFISGLCAKRM